MHLVEMDIGRVVKTFVLTVFCLLLVVAPISAQQSPTPPPSSGNSTFVNDFNALAQQVGVINAVMIIVVVFMFVITIAGVRYILLPILQSSTQKDQAVIAASTQLANTSTQNLQSQRDVADVLGKVVNHMDEMETRIEAEKRQQAIQANSNAARDAINTHTDEVIAPVKEAATQTLSTLSEVEKRLNSLATKDELREFTSQFQPLRESVERLREAIEHQLLPPVPLVTPTPPTTPETPSSPS